jgi:hypothetical protein
MPVGGTVVARNFMDGVTILSSDVKGSVAVEFGAANDPNGDDIQYMPEEIVNSPAFKRALARGVLGLIEDESDAEVINALGKQVEAFQRRQRGAENQIQATIDRPDNNDSVALFCVGPDSRGSGKCGESVIVRDTKKKDDAPPLCDRHKALAAQYVPEHIIPKPGEPGAGEKRVVWNRVTLTARERALA